MENKSSIYSVCRMFVKNREEADDLFQDILINLWNGFSRFRNASSSRTWIYRVSLNTCISYKRKKKISTIPLSFSNDIMEENSSESRQLILLHNRISQLEPIDKAIVLLWLENLPYDEIASIIGITPSAVGVKLMRIKEKLKSL